MKKIYSLTSTLVLSMMLQGCGTSNSGTTNGLFGGTSASSTTSSALGSVLGTLLNGLTSSDDITGTWTYSGPKIIFESENVLSQLGSAVASSKMESSLTNQLSKIGFKPGKSKLTIKDDNTYIFTVGEKEYTGTYTYDTSSHELVLTGALGLSSYKCLASIKSGELYMLHDADSLLSILTKVSNSAKSSSRSTLSTLLNSYSGLKLGWTMKK